VHPLSRFFFLSLSSRILKNHRKKYRRRLNDARAPMSSKESRVVEAKEGYWWCEGCQQTFFGHFTVGQSCVNAFKKCSGFLRAIESPKEISKELEERADEKLASRGNPFELWRLVTERNKDVFVMHVVPRLTSQDLKFFHQVNRASREVVKEASALAKVKGKFQIRALTTIRSLRWAFNRFDGKEEDFFASVARTGNLAFVKWCRKYMKWDYRVCTEAALRGDFAMLKYARSRKNPNTGNKVCDMSGSYRCTCNEAAKSGCLACLKFAFKEKCGCSLTCANKYKVLHIAAREGHLELLRWAIEEGEVEFPEDFSDDEELEDDTPCRVAALGGHLDCLKYCRENGCPWGLWVMESAAFSGSLDCLRYACENGCTWSFFDFDNGCEIFDSGDVWWEGVTQYAAAMGWLDIVQYSFDHGAPWSRYTCEYAVKNGHLDVLRYALANGATFSRDYDWEDIEEEWYGAGSHCARLGNLEMMKLVHQSGGEWGSLTIEFAIKNNHFDCLRYAFEHGAEEADTGDFLMCDIDDEYEGDVGTAAKHGNFAMLKYIVEVMKKEIYERYAFAEEDVGDREECHAAASGSLECLKYIHSLLDEEGYPLLGEACVYAASKGHLSCLQYVVENAKMTLKESAEVLSKACAAAKESKRYMCLEYCRSLLKHDSS